MIFDDPSRPELCELRTRYRLDALVSGARDQYESLRRLLTWVNSLWEHDGNQKPSHPDPLTILSEASQGRRFRCVEYSIVMAAAANALGMLARVVSLRADDSGTRMYGGAHVVAEVWLEQLSKWVFSDAQFAAIPELQHGPLSAVEFKEALPVARQDLLSKTRIAKRSRLERYLKWIEPYLFSLNWRIDQRFFVDDSQRAPGTVMVLR
jgi:transglutaminase-like putative cysteine protease